MTTYKRSEGGLCKTEENGQKKKAEGGRKGSWEKWMTITTQCTPNHLHTSFSQCWEVRVIPFYRWGKLEKLDNFPQVTCMPEKQSIRRLAAHSDNKN